MTFALILQRAENDQSIRVCAFGSARGGEGGGRGGAGVGGGWGVGGGGRGGERGRRARGRGSGGGGGEGGERGAGGGREGGLDKRGVITGGSHHTPRTVPTACGAVGSHVIKRPVEVVNEV